MFGNVSSYFSPVERSEAPALFAAVEKLAKEAGLKMPHIALQIKGMHYGNSLNGKMLKVMHDHIIAVSQWIKLGGNERQSVLLFGNKTLEIMGAANKTQAIKPELSALIAHELGHIHYNDLGKFGIVNISNNSPVLGMAIAMAALAAVEFFHKKKGPKTPEDTR